jgi:hypothetical protein
VGLTDSALCKVLYVIQMIHHLTLFSEDSGWVYVTPKHRYPPTLRHMPVRLKLTGPEINDSFLIWSTMDARACDW